MIQIIRNTRYLQSIGFVKSCGKDTRVKQRDAFRRRIFFDWIFWNLCPLFNTGRNKRKIIKKGCSICSESRKKVIKILIKTWLISSLASDFIRHLLVVFLIFLCFFNATGDDNLYNHSEEERLENTWKNIFKSEKRLKIVLTLT